MPAYLPKNYSKLSALVNIASQFGQQTLYNTEQAEVLEISLASLNAESLEAESIRHQLENTQSQLAQTISAEIAALARLRTAIDELLTSE